MTKDGDACIYRICEDHADEPSQNFPLDPVQVFDREAALPQVVWNIGICPLKAVARVLDEGISFRRSETRHPNNNFGHENFASCFVQRESGFPVGLQKFEDYMMRFERAIRSDDDDFFNKVYIDKVE